MKACISVASRDEYSETFIRDHINRLPCETIAIYGEWPTSEHNRRRIVPSLFRVLARALPSLTPWQDSFLTSFLRKAKVDVVMAEYATTAVPLVEVCRRSRIPLVVHFHGFDAYNVGVLKEFSSGYQRLFEAASAVVVGSRAMEQQVLKLGASPKTLFYNPCGVDCSQFTAGDPSANPPVFVAVGRFVDKKAPHLTLLAFESVLKVCPEARLVMVGNGNLLDACRQMAAALNLDGSVEFRGILSHEEVASVLKKGRALVQHSLTTSYGDSEGTAITILEAVASVLPVVSTRHGGIQDTVIDRQTGFLVNERDVLAMAACMIKLVQDPALARVMGGRAREHVVANFSMDRSIQRLHEILQATVDKQK